MIDPDLSCTFEDARRNTVLHGAALTVDQRVAFFEEVLSLAHSTGSLQASQMLRFRTATAGWPKNQAR